jgi:hypothetical protein
LLGNPISPALGPDGSFSRPIYGKANVPHIR